MLGIQDIAVEGDSNNHKHQKGKAYPQNLKLLKQLNGSNELAGHSKY